MHTRTRDLTLTALATALLCLAGPLTLPVGPVPASLFSAAVMLAGGLLGSRRAAAACGVYLLLGLLGLPVFSGFAGGVGHLAGPTGGFLMGYLPLAVIAGAVCRRTERFPVRLVVLAAGSVLLYALGTAWFCLQTGAAFSAALAVCVLPFLPMDAVKVLLVLAILPGLRRRLHAAGLGGC